MPLTNFKNLLLENYSKYFDDLLSGERSLPFGLLVNTGGKLLVFLMVLYDEARNQTTVLFVIGFLEEGLVLQEICDLYINPRHLLKS